MNERLDSDSEGIITPGSGYMNGRLDSDCIMSLPIQLHMELAVWEDGNDCR